MGFTNYVYVGTYAVLTIPETTESYDKNGCLNKHCKLFEKPQKENFCSICGNKLEKYTTEFIDHLHPSEFLDECDEDIFLLWQEGRDIPEDQWIAMINQNISQIALLIDTYEEEGTELAIPNYHDSIYKFKEKYEKQLQRFKDRGVKVEIKFGIVHYYF